MLSLACCLAAFSSVCPTLAQGGEGDPSPFPTFLKSIAPAPLPDVKAILRKAEADLSEGKEKQALIDLMVKIEPGQKSDPALPDGFVRQVKTGMQAYPRAILCFLLKNHCYVHVAPFVTRADPALEGRVPSGYPAGSSYMNCRAVFTENGILIGSHYYKNGKLLTNLNPLNGVQHEMAHAVDQYLGRPSLSRQFVDLYNQEREVVPLVDRGPISYYLQAGATGPIETFGQLLAHKYCHFFEHHTLTLVRCFPRCKCFVDDLFPAEERPAPEVKNGGG